MYGVPYAVPASPKEPTHGMPAAWAAPAASGKINSSGGMPPVWPGPEGNIQGGSVEPLCASVPGASCRDPAPHDLLALVDTVRFGRARDRAFAEKGIDKRLGTHAAP